MSSMAGSAVVTPICALLREAPESSVRRFGRLVSRSAAMRQSFDQLERLARTDVSVMIFGETGTGKDLCARAVHELSPRSYSPFVIVDCGSVTATLAESEFFGHERGAFTGAISSYAGAFERAHGGTLFLDELGELPLDLQTRLLRVLESRRVRRVGGSQDRLADVRVVAATNRDLRREVAAGRFRQDLYFRIAASIVRVPALRERADDFAMLVPQLLADLGHEDLVVSAPALDVLRAHSWPGNVRELKNVLASAAAFAEALVVEPKHIRLPDCAGDDCALEQLPLGGVPLHDIERVAIQQTLRLMSGNKSNAARMLGIAVSTLYQKLKKYDLQ